MKTCSFFVASISLAIASGPSLARDLYFAVPAEIDAKNTTVYGFWMDLPERDMPSNGESYWMQPFDFGDRRMVDVVISAYTNDSDNYCASWSANTLIVLAKCCWEEGKIGRAGAILSHILPQKLEPMNADSLLWTAKIQASVKSDDSVTNNILGLLSQCETNAPITAHYDQFWQCCRSEHWAEAAPHFEWLSENYGVIPEKYLGFLGWFARTKKEYYRPSDAASRLASLNDEEYFPTPDSNADIEAGSIIIEDSRPKTGKPFIHEIVLDVGGPVRHLPRPGETKNGEPVYKHIFPFDCPEITKSFLESISSNPDATTYEERRIAAFCILAEKDYLRAERAFRDLNDNVADDPDVLMALVELCLLDDSRQEEAFELALRGWDKYRSPAFRYIAIWTALATDQIDAAGKLLVELSRTAKDDPFFEGLSGAAFTWALKTEDLTEARSLVRAVIEVLWKDDWTDYFGNLLCSPLGMAAYQRCWPDSTWVQNVASPTEIRYKFIPREGASSNGNYVW